MFFIPLLGTVNSGKSTILNGLIGYNILPAKKKECTKKGILISSYKSSLNYIKINSLNLK